MMKLIIMDEEDSELEKDISDLGNCNCIYIF